VIAGRAAPGSEVSVLDGDKLVGKVTADKNGEWVLLPPALPPGEHQLSLSQRAPDGTTRKSEGVVAMVVPERRTGAAPQAAPAAPQGSPSPSPSPAPAEPVAVLLPRAGPGAARALQLPRAAIAGRRLVLDVIQYDAAGKVLLFGRAPPQAQIAASLDDKAAGDGSAGAAGEWHLALRQSVPEGKYRLHLAARNKQGAVVGELSLTFQRIAPPAGAVAVDIQPGNNLWRIAQHSYGDGLRYTEIYQANRVQIQDPNLIYPGQVFAVPEKP
jgi:nucleoid-associated protein YgaU